MKKLDFLQPLAVVLALGATVTATESRAATIDIIGADNNTVWRVASSSAVSPSTSDAFLGYVGAFHTSEPASGPLGGNSIYEPNALAATSSSQATGYLVSPSNPAEELGAFSIVTGLTGYTAVKDDSANSSGSYQGDGSVNWGIITAKYFSLKGNGYTAFFRNDSGAALRIDLVTSGSTTGTDSLSHVTEYFAPVPVPAAGILLMTALGGLGLAARRRRKAS